MSNKDFSECHKSYVRLSEAWYYRRELRSPDVTDEVSFGYRHSEGGTLGEMAIQWTCLDGGKPALCLITYNDAWAALATFKDVIDAMAEVDSERITPRQFCAILDQCGFIDETPRKDPDKQCQS